MITKATEERLSTINGLLENPNWTASLFEKYDKLDGHRKDISNLDKSHINKKCEDLFDDIHENIWQLQNEIKNVIIEESFEKGAATGE